MPQAVQWQLLLALLVSCGIVYWMLAPIRKKVHALRLPKRLAIVDLLGLMVLLQLAVGVYAPFHGQQALVPFRPFIVVASLLFVLTLWGASICAATQAGITHSLRRAAVMLILVPGALLVMIAPVVLLVWVYVLLGPGKANVLLLGSPRFLVGMVIVVLTAMVLRYLALWTLRSSRAAVPEGHLA
jgi:hypothetical protein